MGLGSAVALNMNDMIGVGPFITLPLIVAAMGGPQALLGWVLGALFTMCDGMVWAELGASMPEAGGSYYYLKEIYGPNRLGRLISFLFIWQLTFSAPLSIASGCIGLSLYAGYLFPGLQQTLGQHNFHARLPLIGTLDASVLLTQGTFVAMFVCLFAVFLLYRRITAIARLSKLLWIGVIGTILWVIFAGLTHFNASLAFQFPPGAFQLSRSFFLGLGSAMLVATYDYWGAYNICFLGGEVRDPARTIPRAVLYSIVIVAVLYILMNTSVLGVIPWQELCSTSQRGTHNFVISVFMQKMYGRWAGNLVSILIIWTAFASVFSLLLGYSRVPYAAALDGNYFRIFGKLHRKESISLRFAAGAGRGSHRFLPAQTGGRDRRAGGDPHPAAISAAIHRRDHSANPPAGYSTAFPHVALPAAGDSGGDRVCLYPDFESRFPERDSLCRGAADCGGGDLHGAIVEARRVALRQGIAGCGA